MRPQRGLAAPRSGVEIARVRVSERMISIAGGLGEARGPKGRKGRRGAGPLMAGAWGDGRPNEGREGGFQVADCNLEIADWINRLCLNDQDPGELGGGRWPRTSGCFVNRQEPALLRCFGKRQARVCQPLPALARRMRGGGYDPVGRSPFRESTSPVRRRQSTRDSLAASYWRFVFAAGFLARGEKHLSAVSAMNSGNSSCGGGAPWLSSATGSGSTGGVRVPCDSVTVVQVAGHGR